MLRADGARRPAHALDGAPRRRPRVAVDSRLLGWFMEGRRERWGAEPTLRQAAAPWGAAASPEARDWMEIALSAADAQRIVAADRLAVVLGVEVDQVELLVS